MYFPGPRNLNCELRSCAGIGQPDRTSERQQSAEYYAIDGDDAKMLELLLAQGGNNWLQRHQKRPLLHLACEQGAWKCAKYLVNERPDEIDLCYDGYYPIHQAAIQGFKFLRLLLQCGADALVRTATQQMTVLHMVLSGRKSAGETLITIDMLLDHGYRELINEPDTLGNTPLHALIVRYGLEEFHTSELSPWNKSDIVPMVMYLLQNGASPSINHQGNSALACVLQHIYDWELQYELLEMLLQNGGNPNSVGRDGSVPLMVCLVPLMNKDTLHYLTHTKKVFYLKSVQLLCKYGANPNCSSQSNLTPIHVLFFTASEYIILNQEVEKNNAFAFIRQLLVILLQHGLNPNVQFSQRVEHILLALMDMVQNARVPNDLHYVYDLTLVLIQYGADPNTSIRSSETTIRHSQSSLDIFVPSNWVLYQYIQLIAKREDLLNDEEQTFTKLIWLYYFSMNHRELFNCFKMLSTQTTLIPGGSMVAGILRNMRSHPRTLKQISRVAICNAMDNRVAPNVNQLPLPKPLKEYLLEWKP